MKRRLGTMMAVGLLAATFCQAQGGGQMGGGRMGGQMGGGGPGGQHDVFSQAFFPPDFVMKNQQDLALTEDQETVIKDVLKEQMGEFASMQWEQTEVQDALTELVKAEVIDEAKVLEQVDKLLTVEGKIKKLQVSGMIKVRNILTPEQIATLKEKKMAMRPMGMGGRGGARAGMQPPPMAPPSQTEPEMETGAAAPTEPASPATESATP